MKENQLVWKRMSLYEIKWACVKVRVNPLLLTRLAKPHPANARQTTWTQRHPGISSVQSSPYCIEHAPVRVFGLATSAGTTSSCTRRWRNSSSTPTPTTIFRKSTWKVKCFKGAKRREPDFQQQGHPSDIFFDIHHLQPRFSGSAHVQHLRKHPKKYEAAVVEFLKRTMSVVEEVEEVGSWIAWLNLGISTKIG